MALIISDYFQQSDDKLTIADYDATGIYNVTSNPGGFGAPNPLVAAFVACTIDCYAPDPTTLLPSSTILATLNAYPTLPNSSILSFVIDSVAVLGSSQAFTDGIWRFVRTISTASDPAVTYTSDTKVPIIASVKCCIDNLVLVADSCTCKGKSNVDLLLAKAQLDQLYVQDRTTGDISDAESCNLWNKAAEIIIGAQAICASSNCPSCSSSKCC